MEVVYVQRGGDASVKWLMWGALIGAGVALLYAPRPGEETRRQLQRLLWRLRAMTEEKFDEVAEQLGDAKERVRRMAGGEAGPEAPGGTPGAVSARDELEQRLAAARARRRATDLEEPSA